MKKDFLKEVVTFIVGKHAEEIVEHLDNKKHVNEFLVAKKMDLTVNQVRNILYKLSYQGVVSYVKKKDKKKGWYTFFWRIESFKALEFLEKALSKKLDEVKSQINSRETKLFYVCKTCNIEVTEEKALSYDFTCQECGAVFEVKDNESDLRSYKKEMDKLEKELEEVRQEISEEKDKMDKQAARKDKREAKKKAEERAKKREARKKEREKAKTLEKNDTSKTKTKAKKKTSTSTKKTKAKEVKKKASKTKTKAKKKTSTSTKKTKVSKK